MMFLRRIRARWTAVRLHFAGHKRAARMALQWQPPALSREDTARMKANLIRRYPG